MVNFKELKVGDKLEITGMGAPGFAKLGDIVEVSKALDDRVYVKNDSGREVFFVLTCGAQRLKAVGINH